MRNTQSHFGLLIFIFQFAYFELTRLDELQYLACEIDLSFESADALLEKL